MLEVALARWNDVLPKLLLAATSSHGQFDGVLSQIADPLDFDDNVALARLARACASPPESFDFASKSMQQNRNEKEAVGLARPPEKLTQQ